MKVSVLLLLGTSMFLGGLCKKEKKEEPFFVDIVVPESGRDLGATVAFIHDTLDSVEGLRVEQAFKVVGEPRVLGVVRSDALCAWSPLEDALFAANISMTVTSLYRAEDLDADLNIDSDLLAKAPAPANLTGDYIYFWDMTFIMQGLTGPEYKEEIRASAEHALRRRIDGLQELSYQALGDLPFRLLVFSALSPQSSELIVWSFNRGQLEFTSAVRRVQYLHDYVYNRRCN
ncbi:uncharacterized protein LOC124262580 [Haliotis rubra]|uniref:uncharacterized protein LOC124262580 n=1 Tax=Haliotis rubra TaxID=36100 RepID=UPI001EE56012|nr:uncharacterized protein LOC124262580 [Haliotis rubra]